MSKIERPIERGAVFYKSSIRFLKRLGFRRDASLTILAVVIGALTGLGSVAFTKLIELAHDLCYSPGGLYGGRGLLLVLLPAAGALLVGLITYYFAREARGHGVPEVMDAIARKDSVIRPRVALAKAVSSALTIGSGGSAGTEGPIIQIGAALGSTAGQYFQIAKHNMPVLVGCGAAAGISAIFHAPIAGVLFALEIFLRDLNFKTFSPVLIASVISSVVVSALLGTNEALFPLVHPDTEYSFQWFELGNYIVLGLLCAAAAVFFIRLLYATEDLFSRLKVHHVAKPVIGAVGLGLLGLIMVYLLGDTRVGEPGIFGNGYLMIGRCIGAGIGEGAAALNLNIGILLALAVLKTLATCCTLGSGGSGGIFAPSLFLGAVVGYAFGLTLQKVGVFAHINPETYALVGMASVVSATTHAPIAGIVILFEMTHNYQIILPVMFSATIALAVAQLLFRDSIYTLKLRRRGINFETLADTAVLRRLNVDMVMQPRFEIVYDDTSLQDVIKKAVNLEVGDFIVTDHAGHYKGLLVGHDLRAALLQPESVPFLLAGDLARADVATVSRDETLDKVLDKFSRMEVNGMAVHTEADQNQFIGFVTRAALMRRYQQELQNK
ncbi:MAG: chloride channel protein [Sedimentisphaerales bacterium]|nr:chloride channel protein [Sedimentisphaerales bacterium]